MTSTSSFPLEAPEGTINEASIQASLFRTTTIDADPYESLQAVEGVEVDHGLAGATDECADVLVGLQRRHLADEEGVGPEDESVHHLLAVGRPGVVVRRRLAPLDGELVEVERDQIPLPRSPVLRRQTGAQ